MGRNGTWLRGCAGELCAIYHVLESVSLTLHLFRVPYYVTQACNGVLERTHLVLAFPRFAHGSTQPEPLLSQEAVGEHLMNMKCFMFPAHCTAKAFTNVLSNEKVLTRRQFHHVFISLLARESEQWPAGATKKHAYAVLLL